MRAPSTTRPAVLPVAIGLTLALLALGPTDAHACSCVRPPPPLEALAQANAVFEARVARIETDTAALRMTAHLIVVRQWKGDLPEDVTVVTASQGSLCGFPFQPDQRVLLYVDGAPDSMSVSMCSRSRPVELAGEDLAALLDLPVSGPRRPAAASSGTGAGGGGGGQSSGGQQTVPPPQPPRQAAPAAPRTGGCGGCGGASAAGVGVLLVAIPRRRRQSS